MQSQADLMPPSSASPSDPLLRVEGLHVSFRHPVDPPTEALRGIDLTIERGEMVGLVGESGAGKTTLARAIMGLVPQPGRIDAGTISFRGQVMADLGDDALRAIRGRNLAMVIPNPRSELNPVLTVGEQIGNVVRHHLGLGRSAARAAALDMLKAVSIPDPARRLDAYPHELSGGMAQRVVIAIALACSPAFVISDDATSGLDVTVQAQILDLLRTLIRAKDSSALFITRDIAITAHFCDRIVVLYAGEVVEVATVDTFFDRPTHPYSLMLLAAFSHSADLRRRWTVPPDETLPGAGEGCVFAPRCVRRQPRCTSEHPALRRLGDARAVRCHFPVGI
ncbi:ABC transporter ATP-binding protein [Lichenifustis flavocetrariae]|uniref:Nickel import system ATP-binding protein NikD n=1 Tax=Lichenifustis flavocetrariae TaxID=2949735 RepID=A0AA41Z4H7_9HYPH|nr:ABC transporter ATP-binding protein [Lichenifustis flavocetrariae]MCW6510165.1 ABC transporter ATP-binding protein [Lichenifustis flavocetrariae]